MFNIIVVFFQRTLIEKLMFLQVNTLLLCISLLPYGLMDSQTKKSWLGWVTTIPPGIRQ